MYNYRFTFNGTANTISIGGSSDPVEIPEIEEEGTEPMLRISAGYIIFIQKHWFIDASVNYSVLTNAFTVDVPEDPEEPAIRCSPKPDSSAVVLQPANASSRAMALATAALT